MNKLLTILMIFCLWSCAKANENIIPGENGGNDNDSVYTSEYTPEAMRKILDKQARDYFDLFWSGECSHPNSKMARIGTERAQGTVALAGSAYAVLSIPVAVERAWISKEEGIERLLHICRFLNTAERFHGAWSHWMDGVTGKALPFNGNQQNSGDLVETSFMMMSLLTCGEYFNGNTTSEKEIKNLIDSFWNTIEWNFYTNKEKVLYWSWDRDLGFAPLKIQGPNEALPAYILALAAPAKNAITQDVYRSGWKGGNGYYNKGRTTYGYLFELGRESKGGPLFTSQHPFLWFNPFLMEDEYIDYWKFCINHAMINHHYCLYEAPKAYKYDENNWGLSACYGTPEKGYVGRSPSKDDGIICTTAAAGSIVFTPFYALQAMKYMKSQSNLNGKYGLIDSYSPSENWNETRYLSISIFPVISMIENYKSGLIWKLAMQNEYIKKGLQLAGIHEPAYKNGFYSLQVNTASGYYDMAAHAYKEKYLLDYYYTGTDNPVFEFRSDSGKIFTIEPTDFTPGKNQLSINYTEFPKEKYTVRMLSEEKEIDMIKIWLR
ncbi:MAG: hypothetical protein FWD60_01535 [Candidatus Azobacteroides sp.]|nr:hypothetical protein [Candidatus Azobacteroides sp.]